MSKISVIVPVYNVKRYLERCVNSILRQTMQDIEILLIDDGSSDGSGELCDRLAKEDNRIKVIHQKNGGLSAARNTGIKNASADFLLFVDSDDFIRKNTCIRMWKRAVKDQCDIVAADAYSLHGRKVRTELHRNLDTGKIYDGQEFLVESVMQKVAAMPAPFALYSRKLISENNLYFKDGILHEDELWTPQVYLKAKRVAYEEYPFYYHFYREGSITHMENKEKNSRDLMQNCFELYEIYEKLDKKSKLYLEDYLCMLYLSAVYMGNDFYADRAFALKTAFSRRNRIKAGLYWFSPKLYIGVNKLLKRIRKSVVGENI